MRTPDERREQHVSQPDLPHMVRLVLAADAVRNLADGEFDQAPEALEYRITCRRNGEYQSSLEVEVVGAAGFVLGGFSL